MVRAEQLQKKYNNVVALNLEKLEIPRGEAFGLVGNNGAGKTTFFRLLLDMILPTNGNAYINDINVRQNHEWKRYTGAYLDESFLIGYLTPEEYFLFLAKIYKLSRNELKTFLNTFDDFFRGAVLNQGKYIRELSKGNIKKVGIVSAMIADPEIIILDEPFENLDPGSQIMLKQMVRDETKRREVTYLISSHDLNHVTDVCERIVLLEDGKAIKDLKGDEHTLATLEDYFTSSGSSYSQ